MNNLYNIAITLIFFCSQAYQAFPTGKTHSSTRNLHSLYAMRNRHLFEGDILRHRHHKLHKSDKFRNAVHSDEQLWPNGMIPYQMDPTLASQGELIQKAMQHIESRTCVRFREKTQVDEFFVLVTANETGCFSSVGRITNEDQQATVNLGDGCYHMGIVVHELMHAIGYDHMHSRHDRDEYLKIHYENIDKNEFDQFELLHPSEERIFTPFDFDSVMLYGPLAFSKDDKSPTMEPKLSGFKMIEVYDKAGLSKLDAESINKLYKCDRNNKL